MANWYFKHILTNEKGAKYRIFLRDFENETGYSDSPDARKNKLGTTKHLMYAFRKLKETPGLMKRMSTTYPFIEIYCDPLNGMRMVCDSTYLIDEETMPDTHFNNEEVLVAEPESTIKNNKRSEEIDLSEEIGTTTESAPLESPGTESPQTAEIEQVMNSGLQFLSGLFKMSTGKDMGLENQSIEVNKNTGEVTMKFKLPGYN